MNSSGARFSRVNTVFGRLGLVWLMVAQFAAPSVALAQNVPDAGTAGNVATPVESAVASHPESVSAPVDLNLGSVVANLTAGELVQSSVNIQVGANTQSVTGQTLVTPAQLVAIMQVVSSGNQSIVLGDSGNAIGGSLHLGHELLGNLGNVVIPEKVTAFRDFGLSSTLNLAGALTNFGTLYAVSTNSAVSSATIAASNIYNQPGALITSVLPTTSFAGYSNLVSNLSLNLCAVNDIVNAGMISSAGNLSVIAGGSIVNALPTGMTGAQPVMSALQNLNIMSTVGNIVNSGVMAAGIGNVNLASAVTQNLMVTNIAGTIQALNGSIKRILLTTEYKPGSRSARRRSGLYRQQRWHHQSKYIWRRSSKPQCRSKWSINPSTKSGRNTV